MDDEVPGPVEPADDPAPVPEIPTLPPEVESGADELRQLIDAGASSPEELRALAARIREQKALEESLWRSEVRPTLLKSKKRRLSIGDLVDRPEEPRSGTSLGMAAVLAGVALVLLLIATQTSFLLILLPVLGVVVYAFVQGRQGPTDDLATADPPPETPTD